MYIIYWCAKHCRRPWRLRPWEITGMVSQVWDKVACNDCGSKRQCRGRCGQRKTILEFTPREWQEAGKPKSKQGKCLQCAGRHAKDPLEVKKCTGRCQQKLPEMCFSPQMWTKVAANKIKCKVCTKPTKDTTLEGLLECSKCGTDLPRSQFSDTEWHGKNRTHTCRNCASSSTAPGNKGFWTCVQCKNKLEKNLFRLWMAAKNRDTANRTQRCNVCWTNHVAREKKHLLVSM